MQSIEDFGYGKGYVLLAEEFAKFLGYGPTDGNYALTGQRENNTSSGQDVFLAKIDPNGNQLWWRNFTYSGIETAH